MIYILVIIIYLIQFKKSYLFSMELFLISFDFLINEKVEVFLFSYNIFNFSFNFLIDLGIYFKLKFEYSFFISKLNYFEEFLL